MLLNMKQMLSVAMENNFAVPAFNISDYAMLNGIVQAAQEMRAPVIIEIHPDELDHLGEEAVCAIREMAHRTFIPMVIHLDHGSEFAQIVKAIRCGFTSVMIDGSALPFENNIDICRKVAETAHAVGISVEGELGTIGSTDAQTEGRENRIIYTNPEDAEIFAKRTGIDSLAVAIGTSHGLYPKGMVPRLRLDLLSEIKEKVKIPLVLHGGSNNPDEEIGNAVRRGINKVNISSDIKAAYHDRMREVLKDAKLREPGDIQKPCVEAMKRVAFHKIRLFLAEGKADLY